MLPLLEQAGPVGYELPAELGKVSGSNAGGGDGEQARVCLKCDVATQTSPSLKRKREATAQGFPGGGLPAGIAARENSPTMRQPTLRQVAQLPSLLLPHSLVWALGCIAFVFFSCSHASFPSSVRYELPAELGEGERRASATLRQVRCGNADFAFPEAQTGLPANN